MTGSKKSILITGGLGNLGSWITDYLIKTDKYNITVLSHSSRSVGQKKDYELIVCDISNPEIVNKTLQGKNYNYVIHLASVNEVFEKDYASVSLMVNSYGTRNLLDALKEKKIEKFIYFSTFHVYGINHGKITETQSPQPKNDYALTHLFAEQYIQMYHALTGLPYIIFRLSNSYGCPLERNSSKWYLLFNDLCKSAFSEEKLIIKTNGQAKRDFIYMLDVCQAVENMLNSPVNNEIFNLGSGQSLSLIQIAEYIREAYKEEYKKEIPVIINESDFTQYDQTLCYDITKLQKSITFTPTNAFKKEAKKIFKLLDESQ